ncbi:MAG: sulfite exporter TauE/SafE family protein [Planctomycetota bacterium]
MMGLDDIQAYLHGPGLLAALAGFGLIIGILTGMFGVGGGFMVVPMLKLLFGIDYQLAVGSSLCFTIGASASGAARHMRLKNFEPRSMSILAVSSIFGALLGGTLNDTLKNHVDAEIYTQSMHGLFVVMLLATAYVTFSGAGKETHRRSLLQTIVLGPRINLPKAKLAGVSLPGLVTVGVFIGMMTGMMGIGGGVLYVPLLILVVGLGPHQAVGTSLGVVVFGSIAGTVKYAMIDQVSLIVAIALLVGSTVGIQIGAHICRKMAGTRLRQSFAGMVFLLAVFIAADFVRNLLTD